MCSIEKGRGAGGFGLATVMRKKGQEWEIWTKKEEVVGFPNNNTKKKKTANNI